MVCRKAITGARGVRLLCAIIFFFILLAATACSSGPAEGAWLNAPGWRRARLTAQSTIPDAATIALDESQALYLFLADRRNGEQILRVQRLDRQLNRVWQQELDVRPTRVDQPRVVWDGQELHLLWLDAGALHGATMNREGHRRSPARLLSADVPVESYDVAVDGLGRVAVWFGGSAQRPGVYTLDSATDEDGTPRLIDAEGYRPQIGIDSAGSLHGVWLRHAPGSSEATILYTHGGDDGPASGVTVADFSVSLTAALDGPYFGLDSGDGGGTATVFWSVLERTGLSAGAASTFYVSFPLGRPEAASGRQSLYVPADFDLDYSGIDGSLRAGPRVVLDGSGSRATPLDLWPNEEPARELVVAARASVAYQLRKQASQSVLIYFQEGRPRAYQLLSFSRSNTVAPYVRSDDQGYLYASWMEPATDSGFAAYVAGTAPDVYAALSNVDVGDVRRMLAETLFGLLAGAALSPFAGIVWLIAPLFVLGITSFIRGDDERTISPGSLISLLLALAGYWVVKVATLPGIGEYVPFSSWIPFIPEWLGGALRWGVLVVIAAVALLVAWRYTYRRQAHSALNFMLIYTAVDSVLSMAIYGSIIYGSI